MGVSNAVLARRADIAIGDLEANGGKLDPEQEKRFLNLIKKEPTILQQARWISMSAPQRKINRMGFGSRIMHAAPQGTSPFAEDDGTNDRNLAAALRSKVTTSQITLTTKEVMAEVHIPYEVLEDNIEGAGFEDHILSEMARQAARDLEDLIINGDTGSGDAYLAVLDGLLVQATTNVYDSQGDFASGETVSLIPDTIEGNMLTMPEQYLRNLNDLRYFVGTPSTIRYRGNVAKRSTGYGDSMLTTDGNLMAYGAQIDAAPYMPAANAIFTFPENIIFGVQRNISIETEKDIRAREIIIVLTMRLDSKFDLEEAVVKTTNLGTTVV